MRERRKEGGKGGESPESDKKMSEWSGEREGGKLCRRRRRASPGWGEKGFKQSSSGR